MGGGVFELASDLMPEERELAWMERLSAETGRPVTFACLQNDIDPGQWRRLLAAADAAAARGARLAPQIAARPTSLLLGFEGTAHPVIGHAAYRAIAHLPIDERLRRLADPDVRRAILDEQVQFTDPLTAFVASAFHKLFPLGDPPDYEPAPEESVAAIAARAGKSAAEVAYDSCGVRSSTSRSSSRTR
jgi:N-acyl-D-aspartate/D-glutamate deacylase